MNKELDSLVINHTWYLVDFPIDKRALQNKWVFKLKEEGGKKQYKDRLVVNGFVQKKGIDFDEGFLILVAVEYLHVEKLHVKTTFLDGDSEEEIYMQQP